MPANIARQHRFCSQGISISTPRGGALPQRCVSRSFRTPFQKTAQQRHRILSSKTGAPLIGCFRGDPFAPSNHKSTARSRHPTTTLCRSIYISSSKRSTSAQVEAVTGCCCWTHGRVESDNPLESVEILTPTTRSFATWRRPFPFQQSIFRPRIIYNSFHMMQMHVICVSPADLADMIKHW